MMGDAEGVSHTFTFAPWALGERVALDAHGIQDDPDGGYGFSVLSFGPEGEPLELFRDIFEGVRRALAQHCLAG